MRPFCDLLAFIDLVVKKIELIFDFLVSGAFLRGCCFGECSKQGILSTLQNLLVGFEISIIKAFD